MKINQRAKHELLSQNIFAIRLYFEGISCRKTRIGLSFEGPDADDEVIEVNGIQVSIDPSIEAEAEILTLDYNDAFIFLGLEKDLS